MPRRRTPLFSRFIGSGAVLGALIAILAAALSQRAGGYGALAAYGYFALVGVFLGALIGALVSVVLDSRSARDG